MPKLLPKKTKEKLIEEIKRGMSINKISKNLNLGKSTIYYHYKKIKGKKYKEPIFVSTLSKDEGELLGITIGDGSLCHIKKGGHYCNQIKFGIKNNNYALYVRDKFREFFNKKINLYEYKDKLTLQIKSKKVYYYFKKFLNFKKGKKYCTVKINNLETLPKNFKKGLLKGLIDTDGCISNHSDGRIRVSFYTTSRRLAEQFGKLLEEFNFKYGIYDTKPRIRNIRGKLYNSIKGYSIFLQKNSTIPFIKLINPFKANKIRGPVAHR